MSKLLERSLESLRGELIKIYLISGLKLEGELVDFDDEIIIIQRGQGKDQNIMIRHVSTFQIDMPDSYYNNKRN